MPPIAQGPRLIYNAIKAGTADAARSSVMRGGMKAIGMRAMAGAGMGAGVGGVGSAILPGGEGFFGGAFRGARYGVVGGAALGYAGMGLRTPKAWMAFNRGIGGGAAGGWAGLRGPAAVKRAGLFAQNVGTKTRAAAADAQEAMGMGTTWHNIGPSAEAGQRAATGLDPNPLDLI